MYACAYFSVLVEGGLEAAGAEEHVALVFELRGAFAAAPASLRAFGRVRLESAHERGRICCIENECRCKCTVYEVILVDAGYGMSKYNKSTRTLSHPVVMERSPGPIICWPPAGCELPVDEGVVVVVGLGVREESPHLLMTVRSRPGIKINKIILYSHTCPRVHVHSAFVQWCIARKNILDANETILFGLDAVVCSVESESFESESAPSLEASFFTLESV